MAGSWTIGKCNSQRCRLKRGKLVCISNANMTASMHADWYSPSRISWNGPPFAVSAISHLMISSLQNQKLRSIDHEPISSTLTRLTQPSGTSLPPLAHTVQAHQSPTRAPFCLQAHSSPSPPFCLHCQTAPTLPTSHLQTEQQMPNIQPQHPQNLHGTQMQLPGVRWHRLKTRDRTVSPRRGRTARGHRPIRLGACSNAQTGCAYAGVGWSRLATL
jgi:hypothetical protein